MRLGSLILTGLGVLACSPAQETDGPGGPAQGSASTGTGAGGTGGSNTFTGSAGSISIIDVGGPAGSAGAPQEDVCDSIAVQPEVIEVEEQVEVQVPVEVPIEVEVEVEVPYEVITEVPTALYIMLDKSGSMAQSGLFGLGGGATKWETAVSAITTFVSDSASDGLRVAIQYFPTDNASCDGAGYNTPAVPMTDLPANPNPIVTSLTAESPNGDGTPIGGGLNGLTQFCAQYQSDNAGWNCVGVLITDGQPTDCLFVDLALTARAALQNSGVRTFAVGMDGADFNLLNTIATEGQGDCDPNVTGFQACNVTTSQSAFLDALRLIRQTVSIQTRTETRTETQIEIQYETEYQTEVRTERTPLACEWGIPDPPEGEAFDKDKVNVKATLSGGNEQTIGRVPSEADCARASGGWYYDDPDQPARVLLCPATCTVLEADAAPRVDILLGCATEPAIVR